jgi:hypothetical protein
LQSIKDKQLIKRIFIYSIILLSHTAFSQSIGVRAGWNFNTFRGPLEPGESFSLTNGIHFGINYGYKLSNVFMIRTELLYSQLGTKQKFDGDSYYVIYTSGKTVFEKGNREQNLEISNSNVSIPITAAINLGRKIEVFGGLSPNFLINPTGRGTLRFISKENPSNIVFRQALDYRYYQDKAKTALQNTTSARIIVDKQVVNIPKSVGAYYQTDIKEGNLFNWFSLTTLGGVNYFINRSLFIGGRVEYGLTDVTNSKMDFSLQKLNDDFSTIKRSDKDTYLSYQISMGFRF